VRCEVPMKAIAVLFSVLLIATWLSAQDHAPTTEECRADAALWGDPEAQTEYNKSQTAYVSDGTQNKTDIGQLPYRTISTRMVEMIDCGKVDGQHSDTYFEVQRFYHDVMADRWYNFIRRHNLMNQFMQEDKKGIR
jgi:hypothetical protein